MAGLKPGHSAFATLRSDRRRAPWFRGAGGFKLSPVARQDINPAAENNEREEVMGACAKFAVAGVLGVLASLPQASAEAADLIILTNQGATPGVRELATAFTRASGHKVTVIQEAGEALERRINNGPADLITGNPQPMAELVKKGKVVGATVTPFVLAGLGLSVRAGAPKPNISTVDAYKAALDRKSTRLNSSHSQI